MKIIHCADLHLDSRMTSNLSKEQAKERKMEMLRTFVRMVDYAQKNQVRAIIIAGDMFDTRNVSATARNLVKDTINAHPDIDFLYLKGNHDCDNFLVKLDEIPDNLKLFEDRWTSYEYGNIVISGVELGADNRHLVYNTLVLDQDRYNIVVLHGQTSDYGAKDKAEIIDLNSLKNKNIDYLALGHVHDYKNDRLDNRGVYCYSGCLEGRGFDECGPKGFVMLDINESRLTASFSFVPFAYRNLYIVDVDVTGVMTTSQAAEKIEKTLAEASIASSSMVKLVLTGEVDVDCEINTDFLQDMFEEYFYYEKVQDQSKIYVDYRDYEKDASLKGEFIRMVMNSDMSESRKSEVIRCGIAALSGEEI